MIERTIICDECFHIIAGGTTADAARASVRGSANAEGRTCQVGLPGGRDLCWNCAPATGEADNRD